MKTLVVDDDQALQEVLRDVLEAEGYVVVAADDGEQALRQWDEARPDIVLLDIRMPGMDGIEATRQIRALPGDESRIPIIAVTAHTDGENREACHAAGMNAFIGKPVRPTELLKVIASLMPA